MNKLAQQVLENKVLILDETLTKVKEELDYYDHYLRSDKFKVDSTVQAMDVLELLQRIREQIVVNK